jgi:hypothetical protein
MAICYVCGVTLDSVTGHTRRDMASNAAGWSVTSRGTIRASSWYRTVRRSVCYRCATNMDAGARAVGWIMFGLFLLVLAFGYHLLR